MKYHYQEGICERKEDNRLKLVFLSISGLATLGYIGLLALAPVLNGWPLVSVDQTANALKSYDPGEQGDKLYIPRLNINSPAHALEIKGNPSKSDEVTILGNSFQLGLTPEQTRQNSPFYYIDQLKSGDEIFLDHNNTRFAYRVSARSLNSGVLILKSSSGKSVKAESVGAVARDGSSMQAINDFSF